NSDSALIYYGDVTQSLKNATENVAVNVSKLGGSGASTMARITGRFLTSSNKGPTGTLSMIYRPAGKPAMEVDKKPITSGWFEVCNLQDIAVDYVISEGDEVGKVLGSLWTNASFAPSEKLLRISIPAGYEERWDGTSHRTFAAREAE